MPSPRAQQELEDAIQQLGGLRNAGSRNPEFKQWRQSTLTVVQRLWPGDAVRAERFRRIPFSFPSTRADTKTHREYFERGCAEALQLLKAFLAEVQGMPVEGLPDSLPAMPPVGSPPEIPAEPQSPAGAIDPTPASFLSDVRERSVISPIGADVSFERPAPPVDMPVFDDLADSTPSAVPAAPPPAAEFLDAPEPPPTKGPPRLPVTPARPTAPEQLASEDAGGPNPLTLDPVLPPPSPPPTRPARAEIPAPPAVFPEVPLEPPAPPPAAAPPAAAPPRPAAPAPPATGAPPAGGKSIRATVQRRLKEMLGLDAFEREARAEPEPPKKPGRAGDGGKKEVTAGGQPERPSPQPRPAMPPPADPPVPADPPPRSEAPADDRSARQVTSDFLDASPVLRATARPVPARTPSAPSSALSRDVAQAVDKLARMVGDLEVPEGRRAQARAMLMGLARELDQDSPRWGVVADSITAVMEFPPLARALLPLLLPELDRAA